MLRCGPTQPERFFNQSEYHAHAHREHAYASRTGNCQSAFADESDAASRSVTVWLNFDGTRNCLCRNLRRIPIDCQKCRWSHREVNANVRLLCSKTLLFLSESAQEDEFSKDKRVRRHHFDPIRQLMKITHYVAAAILFILCCSTTETRAQQSDTDKKLKRFLEMGEELRQQAAIPGVGIAIIYKNKILYTGGLGFQNLASRTPVSEDTLFSIGSNTKAFTGLLATKLVSRGLLEWDQPLIQYIPELQLKENYVTHHVTLADALTHRVGLKRDHNVWRGQGLTRTELLGQLKNVEFATSFRSTYNYNNLMYVVAGIAAERVTGVSWESLVRNEILDPLGMNNSYVTMKDFLKCDRRAIGYHNDGIRPAPPVDLTSIAPAGAISSTPKDIANWIRMLVNDGHHQGRPFLTKQEYNYMLRPHKNLSIRNGDELWYYYAGLGGFSKNGKRTVGADGAIDGQNSRCVLLLDEGFGVFVMTNKVSDYKAVLAKYAEQIFLHDDYSRDTEKEALLASRAGFDKFATRLFDEGISSAKEEYEKCDAKPSERMMNQLGYQLLAEKQFEKAVFTLRLNVASFPESFNAHDSLGEAYLKSKKFELARKHYQQSISINPENENARKMIAKIDELSKEQT